MSNKRTILIRAQKKLVTEWKQKYPNVQSSALLTMMWDSSALKFSSWLGESYNQKKKGK